MPHHRKRYLESNLLRATRFSAITGILGHRQVGKTTLVETIAKKYLTLDSKDMRDFAQKKPQLFLKKNSAQPLVIDECQKAPALFDELKEWVRIHKKPGQFVLTGSVRFTSKKSIRESLTGRIVYHELLPFTVSEIEQRPLPNILRSLMLAKNTDSWLQTQVKNSLPKKSLLKAIEAYKAHGGLPGVFFIRNEKLRLQKIAEQLETILDRDLRELINVRLSYSQILNFLEALATQEGAPISYTKIQNETGVSHINTKKIISALESVFLIRLFKVEGGRKGWIFYFEDHAEARYLSKNKLDPSIYEAGFLFRNLRTEFFYEEKYQFRFFHYLTKHNASLPFAIEWNEKYLGILPLKKTSPTHGELMAAYSFLKKYQNSKVLMIHPKASPKEVAERVALLPEFMLF